MGGVDSSVEVGGAKHLGGGGGVATKPCFSTRLAASMQIVRCDNRLPCAPRETCRVWSDYFVLFQSIDLMTTGPRRLVMETIAEFLGACELMGIVCGICVCVWLPPGGVTCVLC